MKKRKENNETWCETPITNVICLNTRIEEILFFINKLFFYKTEAKENETKGVFTPTIYAFSALSCIFEEIKLVVIW